jgi:hypothetical protein
MEFRFLKDFMNEDILVERFSSYFNDAFYCSRDDQLFAMLRLEHMEFRSVEFLGYLVCFHTYNFLYF